MNRDMVSVSAGIVALLAALLADPLVARDVTKPVYTSDSPELDFNEQTHLEFMCEEEKLARDVYITLGSLHPDLRVFGNIDDSEEQHKAAVSGMLDKYGIPNPSTNDNVGVFTGEAWGGYFTEKYQELVLQGSNSKLDALYVGALIEELDMLDINQCPAVIVETDNIIHEVSECGRLYTDNSDIHRLYGYLLEGSMNHLRAFVLNIEKQIGKGNYKAQILSQEEVDAILDR
jgi:hypothetical protein